MHESHGPLKREKKDTMSHKPRSVGPQTNMNRVNNCRTFGQVTSASGQGSTRVSALPAQGTERLDARRDPVSRAAFLQNWARGLSWVS